MSYAQIEMDIIRQIEATRSIDGNIDLDLETIEDYMESLAWFNEQDSLDKMAKMIGWIGISLISICATLDVNFVECLELAHKESESNQEPFDDDDS